MTDDKKKLDWNDESWTYYVLGFTFVIIGITNHSMFAFIAIGITFFIIGVTSSSSKEPPKEGDEKIDEKDPVL